MSKKGPVYRIGDTVKIIDPKFFIRCGYHLTIDSMLEQVNEQDLVEFCRGHGIKWGDLAFDKIHKALAFHLLQKQDFGGPERRIYTREIARHANSIGTVTEKFFVKTDIRTESGPDISPDGIPADGSWSTYLQNEKTHIILRVNLQDEFDSDIPCRIEACNVEKILDYEPPDSVLNFPF